MPVTLTYLFKETRHVPGVFVRDLLRLVDAVRGFAASVDAAVNAFEDGLCLAGLAAFGCSWRLRGCRQGSRPWYRYKEGIVPFRVRFDNNNTVRIPVSYTHLTLPTILLV